MDYHSFKKHMGQQDPSYKYMSDSDMRKKYAEYLNRDQAGNLSHAEERIKTSVSSASQLDGNSSKIADVIVTDIDMPFGSMVKFMVKWSLASIPALLILMAIAVILGILWGAIMQ
jgi:hypothetical protein